MSLSVFIELTSAVKAIFASEKSVLDDSMEPSYDLKLPSTSEITRWATVNFTLVCGLSIVQRLVCAEEDEAVVGLVWEVGAKENSAVTIPIMLKNIIFFIFVF